MKEVIEAYKEGDVKHPKHEIVKVCANCGYDLDEVELDADTCSDCGQPLNLKQSVSIWATSVPKAGGKTMGQT
jgi:ribosomal protein L37E